MTGRATLLLVLVLAASSSGVAAQTAVCKAPTVADIVFLVDSSSGISPDNFRAVRRFLGSIIKALNIGLKEVRVGLAQYTDEPFQEFLLKDHTDKRSLLSAVEQVPHRTGGRETGKAINFTREESFTKEAGSRAKQRVPQIAVVITGGDSTDDVRAPAQLLRQRGVIVFGIAVGQVDLKQLGSIANQPSDRFLFSIESFQALQRLTDGLLETLCITAEDQRRALEDKFADVFFVLDSGIAQASFSVFRSELIKLINQLDAGASTYRVGLAQYADSVHVEFLLNAFQTKQDAVVAVKRLRLRPQHHRPRNVGSALEHAYKNFFTSETGGRAYKGAQQFLVLVSGKDSDDPVARPALTIRSAGITLAAMSAGASMDSLNSFGSPGYVFDSPRATLLKNLIVSEHLDTNVIEDCKEVSVADVVFIVDESDSVGVTNFALVRTFLHSIVSGLDVGPARVRVGVVTYSDSPTALVYLNTFNNKDDILQFIKILPYQPHRGGGRNTGDALTFTRENIFEQKGSRSGVQRAAVLITDGKSDDTVSNAASNLRRAGVTLYAVGIRNADDFQLNEVALQNHVFSLEAFTDLKGLKQSLQKTLCKDIIDTFKVTKDREAVKEACTQKNEADIFFLMDDSGSIGNQDFEDMKNFIIDFVRSFNIGPQNVRMGLVKYATGPTLQFDLTAYSDAVKLEKAVSSILHEGGGTETGKALESMVRYFDRQSRGVPQYLVVITDGQSQDEVTIPANALRERDITVFAVGVKNASEAELKEIAGDKTFFVNHFDALKTIKDDIMTHICTPDICEDVHSDVFFLVDSSESISKEDYQKMKEFIKSVINKSAVGENKIHVGVMQFSTSYNLEFPLTQHYSKEEMYQAIDRMQQLNEGTRTGRAITEVTKYFDVTRGGRSNLKQNLVVVTDGKSNDAVTGPAAALRDKKVVIYAFGVEGANRAELKDIVGSSDRVFNVKDFDALRKLESELAFKFCEPTRNCKKINQVDIIFLVDGSGSIGEQFSSMHTFMESLVNKTTVGKSLAHFGVIIFSDEPKTVFSLNKFDSKQDILEAIRKVRLPDGNTYTGKALDHALEFFNAEHGGRKELKVPQILMVVTDGRANDFNDLKNPSDALRRNGVQVYSVGVKNANREELMTIAGGDKSKVFYVDSFVELESLHRDIYKELCNSTKPVCSKERLDLVFLLDQSDSTNSYDYAIMKNLTRELVKSFKVGKEFVHIGLAQFSSDLRDEFDLKVFSKTEDMIEHIDKMEQRGGDTYIEKALYQIRKYFEASRDRKCGKYLILMTNGDSKDDVEEAADLLSEMGITVFAVGFEDLHLLQLLQISHTPKRVYKIQADEDKEKVKNHLIDNICRDDPPLLDCTVDIAVGFDITRRTRDPDGMIFSDHPKLQDFLPDIIHHVSSIPRLCCVNKQITTQMAFHIVDRNGRSLYDTNFESYNEDVVKKILNLRMSQPTYFNKALLESFKKLFSSQSRAAVKVMVIFSDGLDEEVTDLLTKKEDLIKSGVRALLVVALEDVRNPEQLQMVEFGRGFDYDRPLSIDMPSVGSTVFKQIDSVSERVCCNVTCKCSGPDGPRGPPGPPGPKGASGLKGQPGFFGDEGAPGDRGPGGPDGPPGNQGCPGVRGEKGKRGVSGERGDDGEDGLEGIHGEQGEPGPHGPGGGRGDPGKPGNPGIRGEPGVKGDQGLRGDPGEPGATNTKRGPKGDPGGQGPHGLPGQDGLPGKNGSAGNKGQDGRRGLPGGKGAPGSAGANGTLGSPGAAGPQGARGRIGDPGPKGFPGSPGLQGQPGTPGGPGIEGHRGSKGQEGQSGDPGIKGSPGPQGPRGILGHDGTPGYGPPGRKGGKGDRGLPGYPGEGGDSGDAGGKGYPGHKGNRGRDGPPGGPGIVGIVGEKGRDGHTGPKGPPGTGMHVCQLINITRENCPCCSDQPMCPAFPTELVFALDISEDVRPADFDRQRAALLSLLDDIAITESNCPTGARVAVVAYSAHTKYLIRFQDFRLKEQLKEAVRNISQERTNRRFLGASMRFVGHNVFKHVRAGLTMRRVAVFFSCGSVQDSEEVATAVMEYIALDISLVIISTTNALPVRRALEVDTSGKSLFIVLGRNMAADLRRAKNCVICYDPCRPSQQCTFIQEPVQPQEVDLDLVMVVDSSREVQADEYAGAQQLLGSVVEQLAVSPQPRRAGSQARVAVVQQSGTQVSKSEFGLQAYQNHNRMKTHLIKMQQQGGSSALGQTLEFTLREVLLKAAQPRRRKAVLTVVGTQTAYEDRAKLHYISQKAKCEGVAMFVVTVGDRYNRTQVEELASLPLQQHLIHVSKLKTDEQAYAQRFFRVFLSALNKGMNSYPPPSLKQTCNTLRSSAGEMFTEGQGSAELDEDMLADEETFQEQTQLDVINTVTKEDEHHPMSSPPGANLHVACSLGHDSGGCQDYTVMWFFENSRRSCFPFWYGGCGGNENRFETKEDCEEVCVTKGG